MVREQAFKHFYKTDILPNLFLLEKARKKLLVKMAVAAGLSVIFVPALSAVLYETSNIYVAFGIVFFLCAPPLYINYLLGDTGFYKQFKQKIIGQIITYINPTLHYDNSRTVEPAEFDQSNFFDNKDTIIKGDDFVSGTFGDVKVNFSELVAEFKNESDVRKKDSKYQFKGIFIVAEFPQTFSTDLVAKTIGITFEEGKFATSQDARFNKLFKIKVYENPSGIDFTLTQPIIDALLGLQLRIHNEFIISFVKNKIYLGIYHDEDLFEPAIFQSLLYYDKIKGYFDDLFYPLLFIEEITLGSAKK